MSSQKTLVIVEGMDGSGKTSLANALKKALGFQCHVVDRLTGSSFVYDRLFNRESQHDHLAELEALKAVYYVRQVIVDVSPKTAAKRLAYRGDHGHRIADLEQAQTLFREWFGLSQHIVPTFTVQTEHSTILECCDRIVEWMDPGALIYAR